MALLERDRLSRIVEAVADRLPGDWLLLGGALVALWISPRRVTEDVDLVGLRGSPEDRREIFRLARELGLPVETVNSPADFFVEQIPGWRDDLEVLLRGRLGTVWRPNPTLLLLLKIARLSEQDLADCFALLAKVRWEGLPLDHDRVLAAMDALPPAPDAALSSRRALLRERLAR